MIKLNKYRFSDLYSMSSGISSTKDQAGHGSPFLSFSIAFNSYFLPEELTDLMATSDKEKETYSIKEGDIFLTRTSEVIDELAMSCVAIKDYPKASYSGFLKRLRPTQTDIAYPKFMAFYLRSPIFRKTMTNNAVMTLRASLNEAIFSYLDLLLPDYKEQVRAGDLLYLINRKIELNNRINAELEAMAKTLYDYWFVQFDFPDANGQPYKTAGGKMVYNPTLKCEIPEGWNWKPVSSLIEVKDGTHDSPKPSENGQFLITSKHLKSTGIDFSDAYRISQEDFDAVNKRSKVDAGDFLLSMIGTVGLSQWAMKIETPYAIKNIGLFKTSQAPEIADYIFSAITSLHGKAYLKQNQSTGTSQPYVTLGTLRGIPILLPSEKVLEAFNKKIKPLHKLTYENTVENQRLAELRDWLLPMLMNGQVTVK